MKSLLFTCALAVCAAPLHAAITYIQLDFGESIVTAPVGFTKVSGNFLANTPVASASDIDGLGYNFTVGNVGVYNSGNPESPVASDGFYTFGNDSLPHGFTLSGLTPGQTVSLYAISAWDGNGRGATIGFGDGTAKAQTIGVPGTEPTLANFAFIGTATADSSGIVTGTLNGNGFPGHSDTEGQIGGMIFELGGTVAVPEPCSALLGAFGIISLAARRRRA